MCVGQYIHRCKETLVCGTVCTGVRETLVCRTVCTGVGKHLYVGQYAQVWGNTCM